MGKLVLLLLLAAAGYYWHSHKQDPEQITVPVYAEARVDLQVQGRELGAVDLSGLNFVQSKCALIATRAM